MDSDLARVNGKSGRQSGRYHADAFQRSIISEAIYHFTILRSHVCRGATRTTARSSPVLRRVVDASVEGPRVVLIWIRTDDVAEESQTPGHDRLGDKRLNGAGANYELPGWWLGGEGSLQNMSKAYHWSNASSRFPDFTVTSHIFQSRTVEPVEYSRIFTDCVIEERHIFLVRDFIQPLAISK